VALLHFLLRRRLAQSGSLFWEFVFYATFGMVVTSSVALAGVLLVFSFLIIPAAIGVMFASTLPRQLAIGWIAGILTSAAGFAASFAFDLPTGAAIVCAFGAALALAGLVYPFVRGDRVVAFKVTVHAVRWAVAAVIAGSAIQLAVAPRADLPLIDMLEHTAPSLRHLYFTKAEAAAYQDADEYAERHRLAAEQLIEQERRSRTQGEALDQTAVQRMSSFLKSYAEMRKGEQFVMDEIRARARERVRWIGSLGLLAAALLLAPLPWRRLRGRLSR
jgi:zinc/manganese transport system permease protein